MDDWQATMAAKPRACFGPQVEHHGDVFIRVELTIASSSCHGMKGTRHVRPPESHLLGDEMAMGSVRVLFASSISVVLRLCVLLSACGKPLRLCACACMCPHVAHAPRIRRESAANPLRVPPMQRRAQRHAKPHSACLRVSVFVFIVSLRMSMSVSAHALALVSVCLCVCLRVSVCASYLCCNCVRIVRVCVCQLVCVSSVD